MILVLQNKEITVANLLSGVNRRLILLQLLYQQQVLVTHSLGTKDVIVQLYDTVTDLTVYARVDRNSTHKLL